MNNRFVRILAITMLYCVASNMIHPITPTLIAALGMPDRMFGMLFASMAIGNFLFSTFWGRCADKHGRRGVLVITLLGYAAAQMVFGFSTDARVILVARFIGGGMTGGTAVALLASVVDISSEKERAGRLSVYAAVMSVCNAMGYFAGGMLGTVGLKPVFVLHGALLTLCAALAWIFLPDIPRAQGATGSGKRLSLRTVAGMLTLPSALFFAGVMLANFSSLGFDNAFNYYIQNQLGFPPSVNGAIKAATGLLGLFANLVINRWIARRFESNRALTAVLLLCAGTLFAATFMESASLFIGMNVIFYIFNAMYMPIQQALMAQGRESDYGLLSGIFSSAKALGMIAGALSAGFLYEVRPVLPFYTQAGGFVLAALATIAGYAVSRVRDAKRDSKG